jgi:hypothetical protein
MIITMDQYLKNPQGKGSVLSHVKQWKADYDPRYDGLIAAHGEFETYIFKSSNSNQYFIHVKVPSESYDDVTYDVVLKVIKTGSVSSSSIIDWPLRAISNSPSFVYTYENVFKRNKILVEELKDLLPEETYKGAPKMRNPYGAIGYEKTVYYAIRFVVVNYNTIAKLDAHASKIDIKALYKEFSQFEKVMNKIDREQAKKVEDNKARRKAELPKQRKRYNTMPDTILPKTQQKITTHAKIIGRVDNRVKAVNPIGIKSHKAKTVKKI